MFIWGQVQGTKTSPFKILARLWSQVVSAYHFKDMNKVYRAAGRVLSCDHKLCRLRSNITPTEKIKTSEKNKREMLYQVIFSYFMENTIHMAKVGEGNKGLPSFLRH